MQRTEVDATLWSKIADASASQQLQVWLAGIGRQDWVNAYNEQVQKISTYNVHTDEEKGLASVQSLLQIVDTKLPDPQIIADQQQIRLLAIEGSRTVQHTLQLTLANTGFSKADVFLDNIVEGISINHRSFIFWSQNHITGHTLTLTIAALQLIKNKTYTINIYLDTEFQNLVVPVEVKVVFPMKAYLTQVSKYALFGCLFFALVRYITGIMAGENSWFQHRENAFGYSSLPQNYFAYFIGLMLLLGGLIGSVFLIRKFEKILKKVISAVVFLIILYFLEDYFRYSAYYSIIRIAFLAAFIYLIVAIIGYIRSWIATRKSTVSPAQSVAKKSSGGVWFVLIFILVVLIFVLKEIAGAYSFKAFVFLDNLVKITDSVSPVIFWGMLGLLAGAVYGSFVAWKKYKLSVAINLIPAGILILCIVILVLINKPQSSEALTVAQLVQTEYAYDLVTAENFDSETEKNALYKPLFLLDNNDKTAWMMDIARAGTKEEIRFTFKSLDLYANKHLQCVGFAIKNGYRKTPQLWMNFARAKEISILHNGTFLMFATAGDSSNTNEEIKITPTPVNSFDYISIRINTVYPGEKYKTRAAITELVPIMQYDNF